MAIPRFTLYLRCFSVGLIILGGVVAHRYWGEGWRETLGAGLFIVVGIALWLVGGGSTKSAS